jgi:hypothetical protein
LGALGFVRRNGFRAEQIFLPVGVGLHELELRGMGIGVAHRGVDLGLCEGAARLHFRGDELGERLSSVKRVAFLHSEFFDPTSSPRGDMHFVDFDRARNRLDAGPTSGERRQKEGDDGGATKKLRSLQGAERLPTSC